MKPIFWLGLIISLSAIPFSITIADNQNSPTLVEDHTPWINESGQSVELSSWQDRSVIITMSYTECKKTCPQMTFKKLKEIQEIFDSRKQEAEFIIISFDPKTDTPEVLKQFKSHMGYDRPNWHFLTGSEADTRKFANKMGLGDYWKMDDHILHSFRIAYLDAKKKTTRWLDWDHRQVSSLITGSD